MNYKFIISYDGTKYYGWEHQPGIELTIQGKIENVLKRMVGNDVEVIGAGRTDAGVHAKGMVANARFETSFSCNDIKNYMNKYLPEDIAIIDVREASERFHSRYNAVGKTYEYTCYYGDIKPVFNRKYVYFLDKKPDIASMRRAAVSLTGENDYASFCSNPKMKKSTVRIINNIEIIEEGNLIIFRYNGTGFLQHMVRILTGTLLEVGFGKRAQDSMKQLIMSKDRKLAGFTAPAQGLCLINVEYN